MSVLRLLLLCFLSASIGCGETVETITPLPPQPVTGNVTLDGQPAEGVTVTFFPDADSPAAQMTASGVTDASGKYTLFSGEGKPGAAVGKYRVLFTKLVKPDGSLVGPNELAADVMADNVLPPVYNTPADTPFGAEVIEGGKTFDFDLKSR